MFEHQDRSSDFTKEGRDCSYAMAAMLDDEADKVACPKEAAAIRQAAEWCRRYGWVTVTTLAMIRTGAVDQMQERAA